jgi:hypothetical protein
MEFYFSIINPFPQCLLVEPYGKICHQSKVRDHRKMEVTPALDNMILAFLFFLLSFED